MTTSTSQNNYTKNNNHNHNDHTSNNKQNHRISIRQKTSYNNTPSSWKEKLKQQCLQRARDKRKHTLQIKRQYPQYNTTTNTITNIRNPYNNNHNEIMRNVINEQLQQNDIKVINNNNNSSNTTTTTNNINNNNINNNNISYITEEELYQLMIEIENELQLEQENILQEEIINVKEIQEEQDLCYIQEQIEMYQSSSSGNDKLPSVREMDDIDNDGNNDNNNNVPCPLCHHGNLIQDDYHNVIYCQYYQQRQSQSQQHQQQRQCKVCIHRINTKGLSLVTLKDKLCEVYQEHFDSGCIGMIEFDMIETGDNDTSLVVGCLRCGARAIVV